MMNEALKKFDPAVDRKFLVLLSGIIWSCIGSLLSYRAGSWIADTAGQPLWPVAVGLVLAFMIYRFGFLKLVSKNINRISAKVGKVCIFGFQPWKSYFIIIIMVSMGSALRHSSLPKPYLSIIYFGFGGAMLLSSIRYYRTFSKLDSPA